MSFALPPDVAAGGIINGLVYALLAMGIVLIYRSSEVINFAAAFIGLPSAGLVALLCLQYDVPYWVAIAGGLAAGAMFGAIVELIVVRRLFSSPRVVLLVATIGIAQLALAVLLALPDIDNAARARFPSAITGDRSLGSITLSGPEQMVLIVVPVVAVALGLVMTRTTFGRTVTASADNAPLARLSGISPKRVSTIVWAIAGALSAIALILISADTGNVTQIAVLGPGTMVRALVVAVLAGMRSFPRTLLAGATVGLAEAAIGFNYLDYPNVIEVVLLVAVLVAVYLQSRQAQAVGAATFSFTPRTRPIPRSIQDKWWVRHHGRLVAVFAIAVAAVVPLLVTLPSRHFLYSGILLFGLVALSVSVVTGWSGQLSLGQMAFAGLGGLTAAVLSRGLTFQLSLPGMPAYEIRVEPMSLLPAAAAAAVVAGLVAVIIGSGALRVTGLMLAVTTFVFANTMQRYVFRLEFFTQGNTSGTRLPRGELLGADLSNQRTYYWVVLAAAVLVASVVARLRRRAPGRLIRAVRDNPNSASAYTINPARTKLVAFGVSGIVAGFAGALLGGLVQNIDTNSIFTVTDSLTVVSMAVIGGLGSILGPFVGAVWVRGLPTFFPDNPIVPLLTSSIGLLGLLLYLPGGLVQVAYSARDAVFARAARRAERREPAGPVRATVALTRPAPRVPADPEASPLTTQHLTVRFGGNVAVSDVDLTVGAHEIVGLIGTNGAGKSTVLNAVGGYVPSTGTVRLFGADVSARKAHSRAGLGLGRTFQAATLFPELTVQETVMVALEARRRSSIVGTAVAWPRTARFERARRTDADALVDFLGLGASRDSNIGDLSTGTRRIVEFAGLLALGATVLCLDEPTAGVAQRETEAFGPLLVAIRKELDAAVLIVEHDMPLIMSISDRIYCLEAGKVIASGTPDAVRNDPAVVASYLGTDERAINRSDSARATPGATR